MSRASDKGNGLFPEPEEELPLASVALDLPIRKEFSYRIPERLVPELQLGQRVKVPFRSRAMTGTVVALSHETDLDPARVKFLQGVVEDVPALPQSILEFTKRMAEEYGCSWGTALDAAMPGSLKRRASRTLPGVALAKPEYEIEELLPDLEDRAPKRARVLRTVIELGSPAIVQDLRRLTGLSRSPIETLVKDGYLAFCRVQIEDELLTESRKLEHAPRHDLSQAQEDAVGAVVESLDHEQPESFVLHGVTGSGKTEVYLRILEEVRARDRSAIILVPEISLTPQTVGRFLSRFPDVAVLHSSLTDATRARQWLRIARGEAKIVIGARSALFAPVRDLGLIVVDEEHEATFKQQQAPRYHARDMAVLRGRLEGAAVVLGSATPSLEAMRRCQTGEYRRLVLPERAGAGRMPQIQVVNMRHEKPIRGREPLISKRLEILMREQLAARQQVLLFLNRRGFAPVLWCPDCGETVKCSDCDIPLTWHASRARMLCHYCLDEQRRMELCPSCQGPKLRPLGSGTQRVEEVVARLFPESVIARMDSDTMRTRDSYEKVLTAFRRRDIDILIGTQMIAKGLDFPELTLVGVISADTGLFVPDFRASERCFQVLSQVAGRAGRSVKRGTVVLQTLSPEADPVAYAARHDYAGFVETELAKRRAAAYPPFTRLLRIVCEGEDENATRKEAHAIAERLRLQHPGLPILGPAPAPIYRIRGRFRFHSLIKVPQHGSTESSMSALQSLGASLEGLGDRKLRVLFDVDPMSML